MSLDYYKALRVLALANVVSKEPPLDYSLRKIFRWYSKTFSVPLPDVDDLPLHDILIAYYEDHFEQADERERQKEVDDLSMTPEEQAIEERKKAADAVADFRFRVQVEAEQAAADKLIKPGKFLKEKKSKLPFLEKDDPTFAAGDISMEFVSQDELEELARNPESGSLLGLK